MPFTSYTMELTILAVCVLLSIALYWKSRKTRKLAFPGPKGIPIFGCFFELRGRERHEVMLEWHAKYGGVFTYSVLGKQYLSVGSTDAIHEVLVTRGKDFSGRPARYCAQTLTDGYQNIIHQNNLALHKVLRGASQNVLNTYGRGRGRMEIILDTAVDNLVDSLKKTGGKPFDPWEELYGATSMTVFMLVLHPPESEWRMENLRTEDGSPSARERSFALWRMENLRTEDEIIMMATTMTFQISGQVPVDHASIIRGIKEYCEMVNDSLTPDFGNIMLDVLPMLRSLPWLPPCKRLAEYKQKQSDFFDRLIEPNFKTSKMSEQATLGKSLLAAIGKPYGQEKDQLGLGDKEGHISMTNVKQVCLDMILAGNATTATSSYILLNILQCKPEIQEKIVDEIRAVVGAESRVTLDHKVRMPYTRAVIFELLRYSSIVPLGVSHRTKKDTQLCGTPVPAGIYVLTNLWACHHDPKLWDDPWEFKPERFLDDDGQLVPADHPNRKQLLPFGAGPRVCAGEIMALNRLFLFLANILHKFQLVPPDGASSGSCDARDYKYGAMVNVPNFRLCAIHRKKI